jgi:hypothetical protein
MIYIDAVVLINKGKNRAFYNNKKILLPNSNVGAHCFILPLFQIAVSQYAGPFVYLKSVNTIQTNGKMGIWLTRREMLFRELM